MKDLSTTFKDVKGCLLTQALFLELGYLTKYAMYTLKEDDYEYKGKVYPSIKRLYLEEEDLTEYSFAKKYFYSWKHWERIKANVQIRNYIDDWSSELEIKIRSQSIRGIVDMTAEGSQSFQAAKWLADRGWEKRTPGRPSKADRDRESAIDDRIAEEFSGDIARVLSITGK